MNWRPESEEFPFASGLIMLCGESQYNDQESDPEKMYSGKKDRLDSFVPGKARS